MITIQDKELLTVPEAAALIDFSVRQIRTLIIEKRIAYYKPRHKKILIEKSELENYILSRRVLSADEAASAASSRLRTMAAKR